MFSLTLRQATVVLGFVLATWAADVTMRAQGYTLLEPYRNEKRAERVFAYLSRPETEDVLLVGSSRVAGGFDARLVQRLLSAERQQQTSVYKLGVAGLRSVYLAELLRDAIVKRPPQERLVIALEPRFFCTAVRRTGRRDAPRADDADADALRGEWEGEALADAFGRRFDGLAALWNLPWVRTAASSDLTTFMHAHGGEHQAVAARRAEDERAARNRVGRRDLFDLPPNMEWQWPAPDADEMVAFRLMLDLLDALPCPVTFVRMPLTPGFNEEHMPVVSPRFLAEIVPALEARGHDFYDLQGAPYPTDDRYYFSRTHLNRSGCEQTSAAFVSDVLAPLMRGVTPPAAQR